MPPALGAMSSTPLARAFKDYGALWVMPRQGTHPLLYYSLLWPWGAAVGQSAVILRLLSWLAYGLGAVVMVALLAFWALRPANLFAVGC